MILHFVKIMGLSELFHEKTPQIQVIIRFLLEGKCQNMIQNYGGLIGPKISKFWSSRKLRYEKQYVSEMIPHCFLYFSKYCRDKYGGQGSTTGPGNVKILEVPKFI